MIFTVGHSTRPIDAFIDLLQAHEIERLIDVRTIPRSRRHPHFEKDRLSESLKEVAIVYRHLRGLGGLRRPRPDSRNTAWRNAGFRGYADYMQTMEFEDELQRCIDVAAGGRAALMCAEAVPWRCHRSLIADALMARGVDVRHITSAAAAKPHVLTPWARVEGTRVSYPALLLGANDWH